MPTAELRDKDLLDAVKRLPPEEYDAFIEQALALRARPTVSTLSAAETKLLKRINCGLPGDMSKRHARLSAQRKKGRLTAAEHEELLKLTHDVESRDADRAAALVDLARLRGLPVRVLMKQLGIKALPVHG